MQAFILVGGLGTRLRSVLGDMPKALAPVAGRPFLEYQLRLLRAHSITEVILCTGYRGEEIQATIGNGQSLGLHIVYSQEPEPLGTAGALRHATPLVHGPFLVLNGDTYVEFDLAQLVTFHQARDAVVTIGLAHVDDPRRYGRVRTAPDGRVLAFVEKDAELHPGESVSAGVYLCQPDLLSFIPARRAVSLEREVFPVLTSRRKLYATIIADSFIDMGTPEGYRALQHLLAKAG
ncbi:MAG TPA: nucleoside-diphosphate-sugar pyrophosphorylase [Anaerolineae bacterium]|nr:nucleoside-diphosphate-sugar pyrophosphorylase [Anaerolineae bacterium]